jgi:hypothetical protein
MATSISSCDFSVDPRPPGDGLIAPDLRCLGVCLAAELTGCTREEALDALSYARVLVEDYWDPEAGGE